MINGYLIRNWYVIFWLTVALSFPEASFGQGAVVGYGYGKKWIEELAEYPLTGFPTNAQLDRLSYVIASDIGCLNDGRLFTGKLPNLWNATPPLNNTWNGSKNRWLESLVSRAHAKGVEASICVGGDFFSQATNSTNLNTFVTNIFNFVNVHGFDGVDIDWERPRNETEWNQCIALLQALRTAMPAKRITIALPCSTSFYPNSAVQQNILNTVHAIHLMTYDEGGWLNHSNTAKSIDAINSWITWGSPTCEQKRKLFLGCAFYGWHPVVGEENSGIRISYHDFFNKTKIWSNPGDLPADVITKAAHCLNNGFGGVFTWELGYDLPADHPQSLLKTIYDVKFISGQSLVCNSGNLFKLPEGTSVTWSISSNLTYVSGQGSAQYWVKAASSATSGTGWVQATVNSTCGPVELPRKDVWVGIPGNFTTVPASTIYQPYNTLFNVSAYPTSTADQGTFIWHTNGGVSLSGGNTGSIASFFSSSTDNCGVITVTPQNTCGVRQGVYNSSITVITGMGGDCGGIELPMGQETNEWSVKVSPNPAHDYLDLVILFDEKLVSQHQSNNYQISIYNANLFSTPVETLNSTAPVIKIPTKHLSAGNFMYCL